MGPAVVPQWPMDMVEGMFAIRPATDADHAAVAGVITDAQPDDPPVTVEVLRWVLSRADPERPHPFLVAEEAGQTVGCVILRRVPELLPLVLILDVHPEFQGRGIGSALLEAALSDASQGTEVGVNVSAAHPEGVDFALHRGFVEEFRTYESTLDMAAFNAEAYAANMASLASLGYRFTSLAEEDSPQLRRALHELNLTVTKDIPTVLELQPTTFEEWTRDWIMAPHALPAAFSIALWQGSPVGFSYVISQSEGVGYMWMTGVAREHRGKGLAFAVKVEALRAAQALGLREVITNNDLDNAPMLAINRRLGFQDRPARIGFKKRLA